MPLTIGFLIFPNMQQLDFTAPYEVFASAPDTSIELFWKDKSVLRSVTGLTFQASSGIETPRDLDVFCIPGGLGVNPLLDDEAILAFVRAQTARSRYVTSVCTGALVLGAAGLLRGKRATTHWASHDLLAAFGAIPTEARVVQDGNLITAGGVTAGIDFGLAVLAELRSVADAQAVQLALEYAPAPPFDAGTPRTAPEAVLRTVRARQAASRREREAIIARLPR